MRTRTASRGIAMNRIAGTRYALEGTVGAYLNGVTEQWLKIAPFANPAMLEMFRDRDRKPYREMVPWAGEFAGKHLTAAVQVVRVTGDAGLRKTIAQFVDLLLPLQAKDGYLGPWPKPSRLTGKAPNVSRSRGTWDAWGHYHVMLGLLLWHEESADERVLDCVTRMGDLICAKFLGRRKRRLVDTGSTEMNLAVIHSLCLLYRANPQSRYLDMALQILDEFSAKGPDGPLAGDYLNTALNGLEFYETPRPRWESLHPIMGMLELYRLTGDDHCRAAFEHIWWSIVKLDRHNNGGFSSGEKAQGSPYHPGAIETCCTIAWMATSVEMLRLTGSPIVADELELSTLNSVLGLHSHTGRWVTYNTPMDGVRKASAHDIVFQAREGTPELNCCSVNGPRGLGLISDWAVMQVDDELVLNHYGPGTLAPKLGRSRVTLRQDTDYPRTGRITIHVNLGKPGTFALNLRIPHWSERTRVQVNDGRATRPESGTYCRLNREWKTGDTIQLQLDMRPHFWRGQDECAGKSSIYRGPILLTYDRRLNEMDPHRIPQLDASRLNLRRIESDTWLPTMVVADCSGKNGARVRLCDFASAGEGGAPYRTWLNVKGTRSVAFSPSNPLRTGRP